MESASSEQVLNPSETIKLYKYRWIIISIFGFYSAVNLAQFSQFTIIADILKEYYKVDSIHLDLSSMVFMFSFIILFAPVGYIVEKTSLKTSAVLSAGLTLAGNALKLLAVVPERYYMVLISQTIVAISQIFMLVVPSKVASSWFGAEEVSTACAIAVFGTQMGTAVGSVFPTIFVKNGDQQKVKNELSEMFIYNVIISGVAFLLVVVFFRSKPASPPSRSQVLLNETEGDEITFYIALKKFARNRDFLLVLLSFGINYGFWNCFCVLVNQIYKHFFPNADDDTDLGILTFATVLAGGCLGSLVFGYILDKTHKFKLVSFIVLFSSFAASSLQSIAIYYKSRIGTFITVPIYGFFTGSLLVISYEYAIETTYPIPEEFGASVLNVTVYIFATAFTLILNYILDYAGYLTGFIVIAILNAVGAFSILFVSPELKRRNANLMKDESGPSQS